jgi:chromate transporter
LSLPEGQARPSLASLFLSFLRLGAVSFGGPATVAYIRRMAVTRKGWIADDEFQHGVALVQAVPGATAMQCAGFVGLRARRLRGAVAAYLGFGLPAFALMLALSMAYRHLGRVPAVTSTLTGLRALVVALVANATWSFCRVSLKRPGEVVFCLGTAALFFTGGSPLLIVLAAGLAGILLLSAPSPKTTNETPRPVDHRRVLRAPVAILAFGAALLGALFLCDRQLADLGLVMMKVDILAFGGGFASVPLMFREIVRVRGWMPASVFMDGIALGQVTPGPIVITATFVGYYLAGFAGAVVGTLSVFLPSLFVLVLVEPWFQRLRANPAFQRASRGIALSFVGLLASVTVHFALVTPWSVPAVIIAVLGLAALLLKVDVLWVVVVGAVAAAFLL